MVVHLTPVMIQKTIDTRSAKRQIERCTLRLDAATFPAYGIEKLSRDVQRIVVQFHGNAYGAIKNLFVHATDFGPAALNAADRIVHRSVVEGRPVLPHQHDVARIECAIELRERVTGMGEIAEILESGDGLERGGNSG